MFYDEAPSTIMQMLLSYTVISSMLLCGRKVRNLPKDDEERSFTISSNQYWRYCYAPKGSSQPGLQHIGMCSGCSQVCRVYDGVRFHELMFKSCYSKVTERTIERVRSPAREMSPRKFYSHASRSSSTPGHHSRRSRPQPRTPMDPTPTKCSATCQHRGRASKEISELERVLVSIKNLLNTESTLIHGLSEGVQIDSLIIGPEGSAYENMSTVEDQELSEIQKWHNEFLDTLDVLLAERRADGTLDALDLLFHCLPFRFVFSFLSA